MCIHSSDETLTDGLEATTILKKLQNWEGKISHGNIYGRRKKYEVRKGRLAFGTEICEQKVS